MRSYSQYCAVAKALDVLGDRWTLLIIRELLLSGPSRYTDLRNGLPGVATNLLADRLRELEAAGLIEREDAPPPVASTLFRLTARGEAIRPVIHELGLWGVPYMAEGPEPQDVFRGRWLVWPAELFLTDSEPDGPPLAIELRAEGEAVVIEAEDGVVTVRAGSAEQADAVISGAPHEILGLLSGHLDVEEARRRGLEVEGAVGVLDRLTPADPVPLA
jgi:DNA-binding HxlR family transcriptional regulator